MTSVSVIPKGLHHLEHVHKNKFLAKWPSRLPHPPTQFIHPKNRIRRWNIRPQDKVRLLVGRPQDKWLDEAQGSSGGWRVYTVRTVDLERNRVTIEGLSNKRSATSSPKPANFDQFSDEERREWENKTNIAPTSRPVHYSNVQLCVEDRSGPESVFASRVSTSAPFFNKGVRRLEWDRFASKLSGESGVAPDADRGLVRIPWPEVKKAEVPPASELDTATPNSQSTFTVVQPDRLLETQFGGLLPASARSPIPNSEASRAWADQHILSPGIPEVDMSMPLFLSEELSPRFSRAKRTAGWNERRELLAYEREAAGRAAVSAWEAGGRDKSLKDVLGKEGAEGLEGVKLRGRTRAEVREAALALFDDQQATIRKTVKAAAKAEMKYTAGEGWVAGEKGIKAERKSRRKANRGDNMLKRMEKLTLEEGKNMVVPERVRRRDIKTGGEL